MVRDTCVVYLPYKVNVIRPSLFWVYEEGTEMARQDWTYIQISKQMAEALDSFLKTDIAKKYSLSDKNQLVRYLVIRFLEKYQKEYRLLVTNQAMENIKKSLRM
jgi:hypothetical protein